MSNIIKLLPDAVANQIAAGEVIQRPASALKELLENAVDAGATEIDVLIKDAGKTLIQVTDNGCGMSAVDIRMCFERHATSKIQKAEDLFAIHTLGFRGEAMASIAAVAHVEAKSRPHDAELGTCLRIEGSKVISQEPCPCKAGTTIAVKNLFFNVPARRNFLKSDQAETRHIMEEFHRVALIRPDIAFSLTHNNKLIYKLPRSSEKSRIVGIFGKAYDQRLLPVEQKTDLLSIKGFIVKPQFAKRTRGEQYFFVNHRFIKHSYLNHAVTNAFSELLPADTFPSYFIHLEVDPADIDVNIHPTKTEVNFKDARYVYAVLHAAVKKSIGMHNLTPTIDFDMDPEINTALGMPAGEKVTPPSVHYNPDYNPFEQKSSGQPATPHAFKKEHQQWEQIFQPDIPAENPEETQTELPGMAGPQAETFFQVHKKFIVCNVKSGLMLIDQNRAHQRILYEFFLEQLQGQKPASQQQLFPQDFHFSAGDISILKELRTELEQLGFMWESFGTNRIVVKGIPENFDSSKTGETLERIIEDFKKESGKPGRDIHIRMARTMATQLAIRYGTILNNEQMADLFNKLFLCQLPEQAPDGSKTLSIIPMEKLEQFLKG
ncbi:DNA mismatch repair endonuclease MutL [Candidatus Sulfidibacterium hydrothermale]|uniref:DNA mismatch repair endonuclease MutL n=1 Tax=Candidatus Sulfidibacterium hydrothermale TaxID=2875962 RepID=UPI001F0A23F0|nr:DNA mismatch repair endonuclease MutL [Candidatus Sulfidibacterium hydrothermale]UBM61057.1 DNA mismatch repair endonuclease MutL [Candidatus Sulfidibacterium hydrothermale]